MMQDRISRNLVRSRMPQFLLDQSEGHLGNQLDVIVPRPVDDPGPGTPTRVLNLEGDSRFGKTLTVAIAAFIRQPVLDVFWGGPIVARIEFGSGGVSSYVEVDVPYGGIPVQNTPTPGAENGVIISLPASAIRVIVRNDGGLIPVDGSGTPKGDIRLDNQNYGYTRVLPVDLISSGFYETGAGATTTVLPLISGQLPLPSTTLGQDGDVIAFYQFTPTVALRSVSARIRSNSGNQIVLAQALPAVPAGPPSPDRFVIGAPFSGNPINVKAMVVEGVRASVGRVSRLFPLASYIALTPLVGAGYSIPPFARSVRFLRDPIGAPVDYLFRAGFDPSVILDSGSVPAGAVSPEFPVPIQANILEVSIGGIGVRKAFADYAIEV
jgi:hypothetical protein